MAESDKKYKISISLNVLNHLGINLYSSIPAVLSEIVANAWDADATEVDISFDLEKGIITITDNGHGMTDDDLNDKFLHVGYQRRVSGEAFSPKYNRPVMGRKGIGKLSLFSIANSIEVHSVKDGIKSGLVLNLSDIQKAIEGNDDSTGGVYYPVPIPDNEIEISLGTKIIIKDFQKNITRAQKYLRTRLARRFAIIGEEHNFIVRINDIDLTVTDRDYFSKLQYIWTIGEQGRQYANLASKAEKNESFDSEITVDEKTYSLSGWIGTFRVAGDTKDEGYESLNKISIIVRGKLAQEDILNEFNEAGIFAKYLIGEIHADFLDNDEMDDIATSSRQKIIEDDPRYQELKKYIDNALQEIKAKWTNYRNEEGEKEARKNAKIDTWMASLSPDKKRKAKKLFGEINRMPVTPDERNHLFTHAVIAFEGLQYKEQLDALDAISAENLTTENFGILSKILSNFNEIESSLYHQITRERISIINTLQEKVTEEDALEKVIQEHLFKNLWLLDPTWERATETPVMEQSVHKEFGAIDAKLDEDEKTGRLDIKYKTSAGAHIIVELKRASVKLKTLKLIEQTDKYKRALKKCLEEIGEGDKPIEVICVLGTLPNDLDEENKNVLKAKQTRIVLYKELINQAQKAYSQYLEKSKDAGELTKFLVNLDSDESD